MYLHYIYIHIKYIYICITVYYTDMCVSVVGMSYLM